MREPFDSGVLAGLLLGVAAQGAHWMITPHPDAGPARTYAVVAQVLVSMAAVMWLVATRRSPRDAVA